MKNRTKVLLTIGLFTLMSTLDGSIVNIALPTMARELNVSTSQITWVVTIYLIVISAIILIFGFDWENNRNKMGLDDFYCRLVIGWTKHRLRLTILTFCTCRASYRSLYVYGNEFWYCGTGFSC